MNPLDKSWEFLKAPVDEKKFKFEQKQRDDEAAAQKKKARDAKSAETKQTKLNLGPKETPLPVVGTKKINVRGEEVEVPQNELGNVPYETHQAALDKIADLNRQIAEAQNRISTTDATVTPGNPPEATPGTGFNLSQAALDRIKYRRGGS